MLHQNQAEQQVWQQAVNEAGGNVPTARLVKDCKSVKATEY